MDQFTKKINKLPISLFVAVGFVSISGVILLYLAAGGRWGPWAINQLVVFSVFFPLAIFAALLNIKLLYRSAYLLYLIGIVMLIAVELFGKTSMGATRWLNLGIISLQPSELVKLTLIIAVARYFHDVHEEKIRFITLIKAALLAITPIMLIIKQPDLGTGLITLMVVTTMFFAAGVDKKYFVISAVGFLMTLPALWYHLHQYQKNRILTFLDPERDPLGNGYNIIQSKIAIGSGGLTGKGMLSGTQSHLNFLPEYHTDFIFAFLAEELGFIGCVVLILIYGVIILKSLSIAANAKTKFAILVGVGATSLFFYHIFVNIAMVMGMLPVVGAPLPFLSYGRTIMVSMLVNFSLIANIAVYQKQELGN